ncbi:MAG TPA: DUF488 family protein [Acidimicrobiales bacterium]|nr:MAG: hypothetical protein B7Z69_06335 [Actinobacteria bacterium 21-73-9]HQU26017.1 DUF488 family protein [Acidimicrobiales bacterium]
MARASAISTGRVYGPPETDGATVLLVDRLWPRGIAKASAPFDRWLKDVAPSPELRTFYGHRPERFAEFARRYRDELRADPSGALGELVALARSGPVVLLTATRDLEHSSARVLATHLRRRLARR